MRSDDHEVTRYCCKCMSTTRWIRSGDMWKCTGDDARHPERRIHGCGKEITHDEFKKITRRKRQFGE